MVAEAIHPFAARDSTCFNSTFTPCSSTDPKLPSDFCCSPTDACISLDSSSSALCCPLGANCSTLQPISCATEEQNVTLFLENPVMTTRLSDKLPECGADGCCPFGYTCKTSAFICSLITDTSSLNPSFRNPAPNSTSTTSSSVSATAMGTSANFNVTSASTEHHQLSQGAIAGAVLASTAVFLSILYFGIVFCRKRRPESWRPSDLDKDANQHDTYKEVACISAFNQYKSTATTDIQELDGNPLLELPGSVMSPGRSAWPGFGFFRNSTTQKFSLKRSTI